MKRFLRIVLPILLLTAPLAVAAQIKLLPPCTDTGNCGITDLLAVFLNLAEYLLGISGAVALAFFVYGGFNYILSRGEPARVKHATDILRSATIGIAIIFLSGVLVRFTIQALTGGTSAIPTIGESCNSATQKSVEDGADGLWVSIPTGKDASGALVPESLRCVKIETAAQKIGDKCLNLNGELAKRNLTIEYSCEDPNSSPFTSCVRGLCPPALSAEVACCTNASLTK